MRRNSILCLFFVFVLEISYAQVPKYWVKSAGGLYADEGIDIATDDQNNTYTTGYFSGRIDFGTSSLVSSGVRDIFICKNDTAGTFLWAIKAGGVNVDQGLGIKVDGLGNIYITGIFTNSASFSGTIINAVGLEDMFVAKYNTNGVLQWVKYGGGPQNDRGNAIAIDDFGNVFVTGQFIGAATFDTYSLTSQIDPFTSIPSVDAFTVKYNASGIIQWAKKGSSKYTDRGIDVDCDSYGNSYVTGQFSDTISFDITYDNSIYNAIFLVKYDSLGNEQWFKKIGGGINNFVSGIAIDNQNKINITGDFRGNVIFFDAVLFTLVTNYSNGIFIAQYDTDGNLIFAKSNGSENEISSKNIAVDDSSNIYIIGNFRCVLTQYSDLYGTGMFNSVGYLDMFVSKYDSVGDFQWARNYGGRYDDSPHGICVNKNYQAIITGGYLHGITIPIDKHFDLSLYPNNNYAYNTISCLDSAKYHHTFWTEGLSDILISNSLDSDIFPFYYYHRKYDTACVRPFVGVCIGNNDAGDLSICPDTIVFCTGGTISARSRTPNSVTSEPSVIAPLFTYLWSTGETTRNINVSSSGIYSVELRTIDGCFVSQDLIHVVVHSIPVKPRITDSKGVNIDEINTQRIYLCKPDSVLLTATNPGSNMVSWNPRSGVPGDVSTTFYSANYSLGDESEIVTYTDSNGCRNSNIVRITVDDEISPMDPRIKLLGGVNDTIPVCEDRRVQLFVYDLLTDSLGLHRCSDVFYYTTASWSINSGSVGYSTLCSTTDISFNPQQTGAFEIICELNSISPCGGMSSFTIYKNIYVIVNPNPVVNPLISGNQFLCPGDSTVLTASGGNYYSWSGNHSQTLTVHLPGSYGVVVSDTNSYGCYDSGYTTFYVSVPFAPVAAMIPSNGLICPNDSVHLFCSNSGSYQWQGPSGIVGGNSSDIYASIPGYYYCLVDSGGCVLASNDLELKQYSTPYLLVTPNNVICPDSSVQINVITNDSSIIQWQAPFSGNNPFQIVYAPGHYSCLVTSCNITTDAGVDILASAVTASINTPGPLDFCPGDSVTLYANPGMVMYQWQPDNSINPYNVVYYSGNYSVITTDGYGCTKESAPVTVNVNNGLPPPVVFANSPLCLGDTLQLTTNSPSATNFNWSGPNSFSSFDAEPKIFNVVFSDTGTYTVSLNQGTCVNTASINIEIDSLPESIISTSDPLCLKLPASIFTNSILDATYQWTSPDGQSHLTNSIQFSPLLSKDTGMYYLVVRKGNCIRTKQYTIYAEDCSVIIPNIITPNNDGKNDYFGLNGVEIEKIDCKIYNRWGKLIYDWDSPNGNWDGTNKVNGHKVADGAYFYIMKLKLFNQLERLYKGYIQVIND